MSKKSRRPREENKPLAGSMVLALTENVTETLGKRLREMRRRQGMSLRELSEKSGLSANTMSLIENSKTSPSVSTLQQIAIALRVPMTAFFESKTIREPIIFTRHGRGERIEFAHGQVEERGSGIGGLRPLIFRIDPNSDGGPQPLAHDGKLFVYCLAGQVVFTFEDRAYQLEPGDSLFFPAKMQHSWCNPLAETSTVMIVMRSDDEAVY